MQNEVDIIRDVSRRMDDAGIAYMLTGSMAMNYYAQPRMTRNIDVVVALTAAEAGKIVELFDRDYFLSEQAVRDSIANESIFNLIHNESVIKVTASCARTRLTGGASSTGGGESRLTISRLGSQARKT
jgi:hypothetical protein